MIPNLKAPITWAGGKASADWVVDRINFQDGGRYAQSEIDDFHPGTLYLSTLSGNLVMHQGDTLVKVDGVWQVREAG